MEQVAIENNGRSSANRPPQQPKTGGFVILLVITAVIGGLLFGYDTGIVSTAMLYISDAPDIGPLSNIYKELIVSLTPGMAGIGALIAGPTSDAFGRRKVIMSASFLFAIGAAICAGAFNVYILLLDRIILGVAIGLSSMLVPIYVSEASPSHIRGRMIIGFQLMITFGLVVAGAVSGGFSFIDPTRVGWRLMLGFAAVPAVIQFVGFIFLPESPRWLAEHDRLEEAEKVLERIYNGQSDWVHFELEEIKAAQEEERKAKLAHGGGKGFVFMRVLQTPHVRKALIIGSLMQMFQQLAGITALMYYTGEIIRSTGVKYIHTTIWISCGIAFVNFSCTLPPLVLIERLGRRILLLVSVGGVIASLLLLGGGFLLINRDTVDLRVQDRYYGFSTSDNSSLSNNTSLKTTFDSCMSTSNCDYCVTKEKCGYCGSNAKKSVFVGQCVPVNADDKSLSVIGKCSNSSNRDDEGGVYSFAATYCATKYTALPIILMVVYLVFFSSGYGPIAWVFNAEVYPIWARSTCVSFATFMNWTFNLIISLTFLTLSEAITKYGAFFLYATITIGAFIFFFIFVPETKGIPIEEVEMLFMTKAKRREAKILLERGNGLGEKKDKYDSISNCNRAKTNTE